MPGMSVTDIKFGCMPLYNFKGKKSEERESEDKSMLVRDKSVLGWHIANNGNLFHFFQY